MQTYIVLRRRGWRTDEELQASAKAGTVATAAMEGRVAWVRSYALAEDDDTRGAICVYQAESPEAVREHARLAGLPADDVIRIGATLLAAPDPEPVLLMS